MYCMISEYSQQTKQVFKVLLHKLYTHYWFLKYIMI